MIRNLQVDMKRLLLNRRFYYCVVGMAVALLVSGIAYVHNCSGITTLEECYDQATGGGFVILFYMLCVVGGGLDYCMDVKNHYMRYMVIRNGVRPYAVSKTITSVISGYVSMFLGQIMYCGMMFVYLMIQNKSVSGILSGGKDFEDMCWFILVFALLGSVLSVVGLFVTAFIPNVFVGMATPVLVYYVVIILSNRYCRNQYLMPSCIYFSYYQLFGSGGRHFLYALLVTICFTVILYTGIYHQMKRRGEHV